MVEGRGWGGVLFLLSRLLGGKGEKSDGTFYGEFAGLGGGEGAEVTLCICYMLTLGNKHGSSDDGFRRKLSQMMGEESGGERNITCPWFISVLVGKGEYSDIYFYTGPGEKGGSRGEVATISPYSRTYKKT